MSRLLEANPEAAAWVDQTKAALCGQGAFAETKGSVIWSDDTGPDGKQLVPIDPEALVKEINTRGFPLFNGHDPGFPVGKVCAAALFHSADGTKFVAAVLGYYNGTRLSFRDLGLDSIPAAASPPYLPPLPDACWINFATDPRQIGSDWVEDTVRSAPLRVQSTTSSLNAVDSPHDLVTIGVLFLVLVWNPFVTAIATEAGKDVYAGMRTWFRHLFNKVSELRDPILEIQAHHDDCYVSFILRGKDVQGHYEAHDALPIAAVQVQCLITNMKRRGLAPKRLVYEYHRQDDKWFPSYAELFDDRLITDNALLIAIEQLPSSLSLGLHNAKDKAFLPTAKALRDRPHAVLVLEAEISSTRPDDDT
jgi:hypothetical protein